VSNGVVLENTVSVLVLACTRLSSREEMRVHPRPAWLILDVSLDFISDRKE
jgi:hypothetical protein